MLAPLIFSAFIYLHPVHEAEKTWQYRLIHSLLFIFASSLQLAPLHPFFIELLEGAKFIGIW